jgi:GrpB-like predicted nucleotidyltransferase (UPF0157 family)
MTILVAKQLINILKKELVKDLTLVDDLVVFLKEKGVEVEKYEDDKNYLQEEFLQKNVQNKQMQIDKLKKNFENIENRDNIL